MSKSKSLKTKINQFSLESFTLGMAWTQISQGNLELHFILTFFFLPTLSSLDKYLQIIVNCHKPTQSLEYSKKLVRPYSSIVWLTVKAVVSTLAIMIHINFNNSFNFSRFQFFHLHFFSSEEVCLHIHTSQQPFAIAFHTFSWTQIIPLTFDTIFLISDVHLNQSYI